MDVHTAVHSPSDIGWLGERDVAAAKRDNTLRISGRAYTLLRDLDGYPPITPPWGSLNAIDLNAGTIRWQIPFGEYAELAAKGLTNTARDNYGGLRQAHTLDLHHRRPSVRVIVCGRGKNGAPGAIVALALP